MLSMHCCRLFCGCSSRSCSGTAGLIAAAFILLLLGACSKGPDLSEGYLIEGPVPFKHRVIDPHPPGGEDCCTDVVAAGDINNDGYLDLVLGSEHDKGTGLVWYEFPLWQRHPVADGEFTTDMQVADVDADGLPDIIVGESERGLMWFSNPGQGDNWQGHVIGPGYVHDIAAGDIDGDGDIDFVTCDKKRVVIWVQTEQGVWKQRTLLERDGEGTALADLDNDGDLDVVLGGIWLEMPQDPLHGEWRQYVFAPDWNKDARVAIGDINRDGRLDVALSASESEGPLAWFAGPADPRSAAWPGQQISTHTLQGAHSLKLADLDHDGDLDLVTAEMHTGGKRVLIYLQDAGAWQEISIAETGSHNLQVADLGADGDLDLIGKNYGGVDRVFEVWENLSSDRALITGCSKDAVIEAGWQYFAIDSARGEEQDQMMGLASGDLNRDGWPDIVAGSLLYLNPAGAGKEWPRITLPDEVDVFFIVNVDGDEYADMVGFHADQAVWLESAGAGAGRWTPRKVASIPNGRTQGYQIAQIFPGGHPELVFTRGMGLYLMQIPDNPVTSDWPVTQISDMTEEEGFAVGDLDDDGDLDIVTSTRDGFHIRGFINPGLATASGNWSSFLIGTSPARLDRMALADIDGDDRADLIVSEESRDLDYNAGIAWYRAPEDPQAGSWERQRVVNMRSANSLDVADFDGDGVMDIATAEHTDMNPGEVAADNRTLLLLNREHGKSWQTVCVDAGPRSSHLGTRAWDIDKDGDLDLVSIAWSQYQDLHLWYNPGRLP